METLVKCSIVVNNLPASLKDYRYILLMPVNGEVWYYGADYDEVRAKEIAKNIGVFVVINDLVENN